MAHGVVRLALMFLKFWLGEVLSSDTTDQREVLRALQSRDRPVIFIFPSESSKSWSENDPDPEDASKHSDLAASAKQCG
jgi:hypothetical protein